MLRPLNLKVPDHNVFMIADLHIRHNRAFIYEPRQFRSVEEHDQTLIHRWNEVVRPDSHVFSLGDTIFNDPSGQELRALFRRLTFGALYLMPGNHFSGWLRVYKEVLAARFPDAVVEDRLVYEVYPLEMLVDDNPNKRVVFIPNYVEAQVNKDLYVLCHYALAAHNRQSHNAVMCCGHSHSNLPLTHKDTGAGRRLDVGVESFGRPISLTEVKRHLVGRGADVRDHHGREGEA